MPEDDPQTQCCRVDLSIVPHAWVSEPALGVPIRAFFGDFGLASSHIFDMK